MPGQHYNTSGSSSTALDLVVIKLAVLVAAESELLKEEIARLNNVLKRQLGPGRTIRRN